MTVSRERSSSLWMDVAVAPDARPLEGEEIADVVVIGSGIAGLSTAYELASRGRDVVVLDRGPIGRGMTARTTAHLTTSPDNSTQSLIALRGEEVARLFHQSQSVAVDRIEQVQRDIECDFRRLPGYLFPGPGTWPSFFDDERDACHRIGTPVDDVAGVPLAGLADVRCLQFPNQATFHPLKYLRGLAREIKRLNGKLYAHTAVEDVAEERGGVVVTAANGCRVHAGCAVVATNSPINDRYALHTKEAPYRTYAMAFELRRSALADALYWDTLDPYHYVRLQPGEDGGDFLIAGGHDHKTGKADDAEIRFEALEAWTRNLIPALGDVTHRWSGQVLETIDDMAFIGRNPGNENVYVATGDSGQGMTHGVAASLLFAGLIAGEPPAWSAIYEPTRKPIKSVGTFIRENLTAVRELAEHLAPGEMSSFDQIAPGQGAIVRQGLSKVAAYRDSTKRLHLCSAACTHLGCHVHWNSLERCWDCPCHGSHFDIDGKVLNGPAIHPLAQVRLPGEHEQAAE